MAAAVTATSALYCAEESTSVSGSTSISTSTSSLESSHSSSAYSQLQSQSLNVGDVNTAGASAGGGGGREGNSGSSGGGSGSSFLERMRRLQEEVQQKGAKLWTAAAAAPNSANSSDNGNSPEGENRIPRVSSRTLLSNLLSDQDSSPIALASSWVHDRITGSVCMWTDPVEVVPCLCSNRRRPVLAEGGATVDVILQKFEYGVRYHEIVKSLNTSTTAIADSILGLEDDDDDDDVNGNVGKQNGDGTVTNKDKDDDSSSSSCLVTFPPKNTTLSNSTKDMSSAAGNAPEQTEASEPFFFGIDCRTEEEKKLGGSITY